MIYEPLQQSISSYMALEKLEYVLASHQKPDIISSLDIWLTQTSSKIVIPSVWEHFIPHLTLLGAPLTGLSQFLTRVLILLWVKHIYRLSPHTFFMLKETFHFMKG